jgi:signal transduction histidine kinase
VSNAPTSRSNDGLVEGLPDVVFRVDGRGRFSFVSGVSERLLGVPAYALVGKRLDEVALPAGLCDAIDAATDQAIHGGEVGRSECSDHGRHLRIRMVQEHDHSRSLLGLIEDVTAARAPRRREVDLLERMLGIVGHDLRGPLSAILVTAQTLAETDASPAVRRILRSALRMQRLIQDILDVSRVRHAGGLPIELETADLAELIADQVDELQRIYPDRELTIAVSGDCRGVWDPGRITELLSNLIDNAIRHGDDGPIDVRCDGPEDGDEVELRIRNRGAIPAAQLATVFDPFSGGQAGNGYSGGLGLGLYICRAVVEAHGGTIAAHSADDTTEMRVSLPRRPAR